MIEKMKKLQFNRLSKRLSRIWFGFFLFIFLSMLITAAVLIPILLFLIRSNIFDLNFKRPVLALMVFLFGSVVVSTIITFILAKKILHPIAGISAATKEVAKGNFDISINEEHRIRELSFLATDFNKMVRGLSGIEVIKSDFIVNVSHEFKTPIATIEGFAELTKSDFITPEERKEYASQIIKCTRQLNNLVDNILALAKLEGQGIDSEKEKFRLDEQIRRIILSLEPLWAGKELELNINMDNAYYYGNENLIAQVWTNLLENAMKFSDNNGKIDVDLSETAGNIVIKISDNGIGISEDDIGLIFNKFYRGKTDKIYSGNGIGLALVKRILDLYSANISCESTPGEGSVFTIFLPNTYNNEK